MSSPARCSLCADGDTLPGPTSTSDDVDALAESVGCGDLEESVVPLTAFPSPGTDEEDVLVIDNDVTVALLLDCLDDVVRRDIDTLPPEESAAVEGYQSCKHNKKPSDQEISKYFQTVLLSVIVL